MTIISFEHQFVFIKTTKTAGTSIEIDLSSVVGDDDIVTPIYPPDPRHRPRNHLGPDGEQRFRNHMPATEIRNLIGRDRFRDMLSFCVEREPVEKCISHFHMLRNSPLHNKRGSYQHSWSEYVEDGQFPNDIAKYSVVWNGKRQLIVDRVLRYDRLARDLPALLQERGIPDFRLTSRAKSEYSQNRLVTVQEVTRSQRDRIHDAFRPSLEVTGIDWD
ncbi:hypothetical protein [Thalassovita aquimarina]|uniref:Sulfotransferase family protein n=1 Tax=Thalassovita aquimarina TaxID=2785917 RepID=A0ABS5HRV6_9RHOB|nr:hypothetical protein [Thalassovita aquimarina]MBR9651487.1 hypothetical protein [Thalassovita aquimarina]